MNIAPLARVPVARLLCPLKTRATSLDPALCCPVA